MKFPIIKDIATQDVVTVNLDTTLEESLNLMHKHNHRNVIIVENLSFYILTASDLLQFKLDGIDFSRKLKDIKLKKISTINKNENILDTISFFEDTIEYVCAINDDGTLFGILTYTDIISHIDPETLMENYRLADLMNMNKNIQKASKDMQTSKILSDMVNSNYDCVIIIEDKQPIGIITTKDIMELMKRSFDLSLPISNYMSTPIETIDENSSIKEAISFMKKKHFKRIVVVNSKNHLTGLILQKELISLSYSKWSILMKEYSEELSEINNILEKKNQKYEKMASTDQLTGLYNRYKFTELFISAYQSMTQRENDMSLIILDIDHFKRINDKYGHNIGDRVLVQTSNLLLRHLRNVDIIGRWGGEEFVVLVPTASIENTEKLANKIREDLSTHDMGDNLKITASFGITKIKQGDTLEDAIKRADDALYKAKNSGRNCVKILL